MPSGLTVPSSRFPRRAFVSRRASLAPRFFPRRLLRVLRARTLFDRRHDVRPFPAESLGIQVLDEVRERCLPGFLVMVVELAELLRVDPEFPSHLHMRMRKAVAHSCVTPVLKVLREFLLAHPGHPTLMSPRARQCVSTQRIGLERKGDPCRTFAEVVRTGAGYE